MAFLKVKDHTDSSAHNELTIINTGSYLEGLVDSNGSIQINGKLKGTVKAAEEIRVGQSGEITGEIHAKNARVAGKIKGKVFVEQKLILEGTSVVIGDLTVGKLVADEGAIFNGHSNMGKKLKIEQSDHIKNEILNIPAHINGTEPAMILKSPDAKKRAVSPQTKKEAPEKEII